MSDSVTIERADESDLAAILALQKRAYAQVGDLYDDYDNPPLTQKPEGIREDWATGTVLKATADGVIVGSVRGFAEGDTCQIGRLTVEPRCQGQGIGRRLLEAVEEAFRGVRRYELFTGHRSERNLRLYDRAGYVEFRRERQSENIELIYLEKICQEAR